MDVRDIAWLSGAEGRTASEHAAALVDERGELSALRRLGRDHGAERARAAVALVAGRRAAASKFPDAGHLFFDREAAEQASGEVVAQHTAARFAGFARIADLGCGAGGDALALARHARVLAVDRNPARLAMLTANATVRGLQARLTTCAADIASWATPDGIEAIWCDPGRRDASGRRIDPESWSPPLSQVLSLTSGLPSGVKLAPGIDLALLPPEDEVEFVSHQGRLVEAVLWRGGLASAPRRATVLPEGASLAGEPDRGHTAVGEPGRYLYDPDPAVGRASLIDLLAPALGAWKLDERVAYLSSDQPASSPFARRFRVHAWLPFAERRLLERLVALGAGRVEVMRRASAVDTNALERRLNRALPGRGPVLTVALTRRGNQPLAIVCERERD